MELNLAGKVAIVTGGGQGMGRAYCLGFAEEGTRVVVADINGETARQTAEEIRSKACSGFIGLYSSAIHQ